MYKFSQFLLGILIISSASTISVYAASYSYTVTDMGNFNPTAINSSGQVAGYTYDAASGVEHAVLYSNGTLTDLGNLGFQNSIATGINDLGWIVGVASTSGGGSRGFLYKNGSMTELGLAGADAINNSGQILSVGSPFHAIVYDNGTITDVNPPGSSGSKGTGINSSGQIVGTCQPPSGNPQVFLYDGVTSAYLGILGSGDFGNQIYINGNAWIAGTYNAAVQQGVLPSPHAFIYKNGTMTDINGANINSFAEGINDNGVVVGKATDAHHYFAFLYKNGTMIDLSTLIDPSSDAGEAAFGINNNGEIITCNSSHAFLLTPIPEPSTVLLLLIGICSLVTFAMCRRRTR